MSWKNIFKENKLNNVIRGLEKDISFMAPNLVLYEKVEPKEKLQWVGKT